MHTYRKKITKCISRQRRNTISLILELLYMRLVDPFKNVMYSIGYMNTHLYFRPMRGCYLETTFSTSSGNLWYTHSKSLRIFSKAFAVIL